MKLTLINDIVSTLLFFAIVFIMTFRYGAIRKDNHYSEGKESHVSLRWYKKFSKVLFIFGTGLTLYSIWSSQSFLLKIYVNEYLQLAGLLMALVGCLMLQKSLTYLGDNYSPLFDSYEPFKIVNTGPYKYLRHPVYSFNLMVSFGFFMSSGSLLVLLYALIGLFHVTLALLNEEKLLTEKFESYRDYKKHTWRLVPFIF